MGMPEASKTAWIRANRFRAILVQPNIEKWDKILYAFFNLFWVIYMESFFKIGLEALGNYSDQFWSNKILVLLCEEPKPPNSMISGFFELVGTLIYWFYLKGYALCSRPPLSGRGLCGGGYFVLAHLPCWVYWLLVALSVLVFLWKAFGS